MTSYPLALRQRMKSTVICLTDLGCVSPPICQSFALDPGQCLVGTHIIGKAQLGAVAHPEIELRQITTCYLGQPATMAFSDPSFPRQSAPAVLTSSVNFAASMSVRMSPGTGSGTQSSRLAGTLG